MTECMVVMYMYVMVKHFASINVPDDAKEQISVVDNKITKFQCFDFYLHLIDVMFITMSFLSMTSTVTLTTTANSSSRVTSTRSYAVLSSVVIIFSMIQPSCTPAYGTDLTLVEYLSLFLDDNLAQLLVLFPV